MRAAGYSVTAECAAPLKTYESCMKIADEIMRGPSRSQYHDADWNRICLDNEWDVRTQERLSASCYQSRSWWRWLGRCIDACWETVVFPFVFSCGKAIDAPLFLISRLCHTGNLGD